MGDDEKQNNGSNGNDSNNDKPKVLPPLDYVVEREQDRVTEKRNDKND